MMNYSILMTVYRGDSPDFFQQSLLSVVEQTVPSDDIVVVEDGPIPEALRRVIRDFQEQGYPVNDIKLSQNVGLGLALNKGIEHCKHSLIARMDADDISLPRRCERLLAAFEADPTLDIVGSPVLEFQGDTGNITGVRDVPKSNEDIHHFAKRRDPFNHPAVMYKKASVLKHGPYGNYRKNQDTDLWIKMLSGGCRGANTEEPLLLFRFDEGTLGKRKNWQNTKSLIGIRYSAYKAGFSSLADWLIVAAVQLSMYLLPAGFQRMVYTMLRRREV
ncbi:glycosyltransferase [Adlercreutzia caecimuris]|uniref:glycosyltransferase n=1 Tax=Adlercreutzia caecimuris TaxID=671266 RepID=UPI0025863B29|nr:glycosyltransferase [Adlercreutzia caecimuris]